MKRHTRALLAFAALGAVVALIVPAVASAHVTRATDVAPAGAEFMRLDVRVPNERDNAGTVKVALQLPSGFLQASPEPVPGWRVNMTKEKLATPIQTDDGPVTEEVRRITWTGNGATGIIRPGEFQDFGLAVSIPGKAGDTLTFKALQTYSNGEVVRWIGAPDSDGAGPAGERRRRHGRRPRRGGDANTGGGHSGHHERMTTTAPRRGSRSPRWSWESSGLLAGGAALIMARRRPGSTA